MNYVLILSGGVGNRFNAPTPKQYIEVNNKPIIAYTLSNFQNNKNIDGIFVVCQPEFNDLIKEITSKYNISKFKSVIAGGKSGFESTKNGVFYLNNILNPNDIVIVHDAVRPVTPSHIIDDCIRVALESGNACASIPINETILMINEQHKGCDVLKRETARKVQTPQAYKIKDMFECFEDATKMNINDSTYINTLMVETGRLINFSKGFEFNLKITTQDDIYFFKSLLNLDEGAIK